MFKMKYMLLVVAAFVFAGCAGQEYKLAQTEKPVTEQEVSDRSIEYRILPQDRLEIALYKDPAQDQMAGGRVGAGFKPARIQIRP